MGCGRHRKVLDGLNCDGEGLLLSAQHQIWLTYAADCREALYQESHSFSDTSKAYANEFLNYKVCLVKKKQYSLI